MGGPVGDVLFGGVTAAQQVIQQISAQPHLGLEGGALAAQFQGQHRHGVFQGLYFNLLHQCRGFDDAQAAKYLSPRQDRHPHQSGLFRRGGGKSPGRFAVHGAVGQAGHH